MIHSTEIHNPASLKTQEYLEGWRRARAELANFRQRALGDNARQAWLNKRAVLEPLLAAVDLLITSQNHFPAHLKQDPWAQGIQHSIHQVEKSLAECGITTINALQQRFDPHRHEAIEQVGNDKYPHVASGTIVDIVQPGYMLDDQVIRPAKVRVVT